MNRTASRFRRSLVVLACTLTLPAALRHPADPPLVEAAKRGDVPRVRALIAQRVDVNAAAGDGMTPLHWAADRGDTAIARLLLKARATVDATTRIGEYTPLHAASRRGHGAVVRLLVTSGSAVDARAIGGATALHFAATSGDTVSIGALVEHKADVNARETEWEQTPLMFAAAADRADAIALLLRRGADASLASRSVSLTEEEARRAAALKKRNEVIRSFLPKHVLDSIAAANAPAPPAATARPEAARRSQATDSATGRPSSDSAADPRRAGPQRPRRDPTPPTSRLTPAQVQQAIDSGRAAMRSAVQQSAAGSTEADTTDGQVAGYAGSVGAMGGLTALHHAVRQGNMAAVNALLDGGADINAITAADSTSPLLHAAVNGHFDLALALVKRGADVKLASTAGLTPLYAVLNTQWLPRSRFPQPQSSQNQRASHIEVMKALIEKGADVNARLTKNLWFFAYNNCGNANCGLENLEGTTPFWRATYAVDVEAMRLLKEAGADPSVPSLRKQVARAPRGGGAATARTPATRRTERDSSARAPGTQRAPVAGDPDTQAFAGGNFDQPSGRLDPASDSAAKAVAPGIGVYPIHAAAGVGYGNGFAGNSHRHAPEGWMPALRYLVEELGADVNQRDLNGYTALHHAAARGDNEMIEYLVSKGADVKAVARNGRTTVDMANGPVQRLRPFPETIALLEKFGAKNNHRCVSC